METIMGLVTFAFLALLTGQAEGQEVRCPTTQAQYLEFARSEIKTRLGQARIPGAVFSVVDRCDTTVLWSVGVADIDTGMLMDPKSTVMRVASTSKLFTALAAADLAVRGKIDLDADINGYLGNAKVPESFGQGITMRQLLTHTAGYDERYVGIVSMDLAAHESLESFVRDEMPDQVRPPGLVTSYSNHAFALAGLVIEKIGQMPFAQYIDHNILKPLKMTSSSFELPSRLRSRLATGYSLQGDQLTREPLDRIRTMPASALVTTAADMSRFLKLQLSAGTVDGKVILPAPAIEEMQRHQFSNTPDISGFGLAFIEREVLGVRVLLHGGEARGFNTMLAVIPKAGVGFFLSYNRFGSDFADSTLRRFVSAFVPGKRNPKAAGQLNSADLANLDFEGTYQMVRYPHSSFTKVGAFVGGFAKEYRVHRNGGDTIVLMPTFGSLRNETDTVWRRTGAASFERVDADGQLVFRDGYMFFMNKPEAGLEKVSLTRSLHFQFSAAIIGLALMLCFAINGILPNPRRKRLGLDGKMPVLTCVILIVFCLALGAYFELVPALEIAYGVPPLVRAILAFGFLSIPTALASWLYLGLAIVRERRFRARWIESTIACLVSTAFILLCMDWNLLKPWEH